MDQKVKPFGQNQRGRIILLGDGTEVLTDSDDTDMFDHGDEDKDLASQVSKSQATDTPAAASDVPEKINPEDPKVKAVADKVLNTADTKPAETTESK